MDKINFQNGITPLNDTNLNQMQDNMENAINESKNKFTLLGAKYFEDTAEVGTEETFNLTESAKNFDLLFIQAAPDFEGGTGLLFPNAPNGTSVTIKCGVGNADWESVIKVYQYSTDTTTIRMKILEKGVNRASNATGVQGIYGIKF